MPVGSSLEAKLRSGHGDGVIRQMLYAGMFFGPIAGYLTLPLRTLRPAAILHYPHNFQYFRRYL